MCMHKFLDPADAADIPSKFGRFCFVVWVLFDRTVMICVLSTGYLLLDEYGLDQGIEYSKVRLEFGGIGIAQILGNGGKIDVVILCRT